LFAAAEVRSAGRGGLVIVSKITGLARSTINRGKQDLDARLAVVELIGATTTKTGLKVESALDTRSYQKGIKVSKAAMTASTSPAISSILNGTTQSGHGTRQNRSSCCSECLSVHCVHLWWVSGASM
jgi:hypothetical protein